MARSGTPHVKNPARVQSGKAGARKRWGDGPQVTVKLDELTPPQRRLALALIDAAKAVLTADAVTDTEQSALLNATQDVLVADPTTDQPSPA